MKKVTCFGKYDYNNSRCRECNDKDCIYETSKVKVINTQDTNDFLTGNAKQEVKKTKTMEAFKPFVLFLQFLIAFACMFVCMKTDVIFYGLFAIFFGWQAGWGMRIFEFTENKKD